MTFEEWWPQYEISHEEGCNKQHWSAPVSECPCSCYEKIIWNAGRDSMRQEVIAEIKALQETT